MSSCPSPGGVRVTTGEEVCEALAEVMDREARVARADGALQAARRRLGEAMARFRGAAEARDAGVELSPRAAALLEEIAALPAGTLPDASTLVSLRKRIVAVLEANPGEVYTPARLAPLVGHSRRDTIRNSLFVLATRGRIEKLGPGQYRARRQEDPGRGGAP